MHSGLCICFYALVLYGWWRDVWSLDRMFDHVGLKNWDAVRTSMYRKGEIKVECRLDVHGGSYNFQAEAKIACGIVESQSTDSVEI
ncbi:hypothetical protein EDD22DRAFT_866034 [Suillus occidentalis]|nr:hypothetical protein EDD22DRAFT_866034 [Suillus occidentalis]